MSDDKLEKQIQRDVVEFLRARGWHVERMLANAYQDGIPDLYCHHKKWGSRWIEVKRPVGYSFTKAQRRKWPQWESVGIPIYILTAATQEQYDLLFGPPNWREFWRDSFQLPTAAEIDAMIDEMTLGGEEPRESLTNDSSQTHQTGLSIGNIFGGPPPSRRGESGEMGDRGG